MSSLPWREFTATMLSWEYIFGCRPFKFDFAYRICEMHFSKNKRRYALYADLEPLENLSVWKGVACPNISVK